jgi:hypothetical protein
MAGTVNLSSAISAGLSGMNAEASAAGDVYGEAPSAYGEAPSVSYAPETPRERQMEYLILLDEVPFYDNPSVDTTQAGTLAKGISLLGSEMVTEDGISMLRSADDQGEFFVAVRNERGERNLQSAFSRTASAAPPAGGGGVEMQRSVSRYGGEGQGGGMANAGFNASRTQSVVRKPVNNRTLRQFRMSQALNTHALKDSENVCVGASVKRMHIPRFYPIFHVNAEFVVNIEWAGRGGLGVLLAALPSLLQWGWLQEMRTGTFDFDPTFGAVAFVFVFSETVGQTMKHIYQAMGGALVAAIVPQLAINTFGHETVPVLLFMGFYCMFVLALPIEQLTKKFSLGMCVMYLMRRAKGSSDGLSIPKPVTYQVVLLGCFGCLCAMLVTSIPFPRTAVGQAFKGIQNCVTDIQFCTRNLVEAYISGENLQDRARTLKYFEHMVGELRNLEHNIDFAWWEQPFGSNGKKEKYKAVLLLIHKLRTDLYGMQKALMKRARDGMHRDIMEKRCFVIDPVTGQNTDSQEFHECLRDLMLTSLRTLREVVTYVAGEGEMEWMDKMSANMSQHKMREKIEGDIKELEELRNALNRFHMDYSSIRSDFSVKADEDRVERDPYLNVFLFNLTAYAQALMDFPKDYAAGLESAQQSQHVFLPETKMVTFSFQKRQLISAFKTSVAIVTAAGLNMQFFEYSFISPVLVAYIMGGHVGGSWANTGDRVVGLITGMLFAFFFQIFSSCETYPIGLGFMIISILSFYLQISSKNHEYVGTVAGFIQCIIMVDISKCTTDTRTQLDVVEQIVLSCLIIGFCELVYWSPSALFYRKQVADTLLDANSIFKEVCDSHINVNLDALKMRQKKDVDIALWRNLPNSLHQQDRYLSDAAMEPALWLPDVPFSAYQQLTTCGRRLNLHLILLHRSLCIISKLREDKNGIDSFREQKLLFDDLVADEDNMHQSAGAEMIALRTLVSDCIEEISGNMRKNLVDDKIVEHGMEAENPDEIDGATREEMVGLDELREDEEEWFMPMHPTGSKHFKLLAKEAQKVMKRVYSFSPDARSSLRKQMSGLGAWVGDKELKTMMIKNGDLMSFHAVALSLREFVEALLEMDKLCWGGDAGWLNAQFQ